MNEKSEPIAFTTEMTPKVDGGGESLFPSEQRLQRSTMRSSEGK